MKKFIRFGFLVFLFALNLNSVAGANSCIKNLGSLTDLNPIIRETAELILSYQNVSSESPRDSFIKMLIQKKLLDLKNTLDAAELSPEQRDEVAALLKQRISELRGQPPDVSSQQEESEARRAEDSLFFTFSHVEEADAVNGPSLVGGTLADWSPDNRYLVYGAQGHIKIFDSQSWKQVGEFWLGSHTAFPDIHLLKFSSDGERLFVVFSNGIYRINLTDMLSTHPHALNAKDYLIYKVAAGDANISSAVLNESENRIVYGGQKGLFEVDIRGEFVSGKNNVINSQLIPQNFCSQADNMAISPNGSLLAVTNRSNKTVKIFDLKTKLLNTTIPKQADSYMSTFSADGATLAVAREGTEIRLIDVATGQVKGTLKAVQNQLGFLFNLSFSPDGRVIVGSWTTANKGDYARVLVWHLPSHFEPNDDEPSENLRFNIGEPINDSWITSLLFSPDGEKLTATGNQIRARIYKRVPLRQIP